MSWFKRSTVHPSARSDYKVRATRHRFAAALVYRVATNPNTACSVTERSWRQARLYDISATGALLEMPKQVLQPGNHVELQISLPQELVGEANVPLLCLARVVRVEPLNGDRMRVAVALQRGALVNDVNVSAPLPPIGTPDVQHKINNLLTAIVGTSELLLLNSGFDPAARSQLTTIRDFAMRAASELQHSKNSAA